MEKMSEVEKMRADFEAWQIENMLKHGISEGTARASLAREDGEYGPFVAQFWMVWQASRAALVVEMPSEEAVPPFPLGHRSRQWPLAWNTALSECRAAVEAAGVRIRA